MTLGEQEAAAAISKADGAELHGRNIRVNEAAPVGDRPRECLDNVLDQEVLVGRLSFQTEQLCLYRRF